MKTQLHIKILIYVMFLFFAESTFSQPTLLKDIYLGPESSMENLGFIKIGDRLLFGANDGIHGRESWLTDGTTSGTIRMEDNTINLIDTIYSPRGNGLFKTNGTEIIYVFANMGFTAVSRVTKVNETWFFVANIDSQNMEELWKSDGTEAGTVLVKKLRPNSYYSAYTTNLIPTPDDTELFFTADDGSGIALWKSDGTTAGTVKVKSFANTPQHKIGSFVNYNNQTYFWAYNSDEQSSLWKTDGTTAGTVLVYERVSCRLSVGNVIVYKNKIYFNGQSQEPPYDSPEELWVSDGTPGGTYLFFATNAGGTNGGNPTGLQIVNNVLVFLARTDLNGVELWVTNGDANGTFMLKDVFPGTESGFLIGSPIKELNKLFFTGYDGNQRMLWETDGTVSGTIPLYDISESDVLVYSNAGYINSKLIFLKETIANGNELWSVNAPLSIDEVENSKKISIYPNPVTNNLTIENPFTGNVQLKVVNNIGQVVLNQNYNTASTRLNVSTLSKGIYFLNITSEDFRAQSIKFIKN